MKRAKPVVAHVHGTFFTRSETFIYHYASHHRRFHPVYIASLFENLDQFPLPKKDMFNVQCVRFSVPWIREKVFGPDIHLERILRTRNVRLIHAHFGMGGVSALGAAKTTRTPLVTTFYGFDMSRLATQEYWVTQYRLLFEQGDLFLVEGPHMKAALAALGCPESRIQIQRIAIPIERIAYRPRKPKGRHEKVILAFSGRFVEKKGLIYILHSLQELRNTFQNFEFRIIGDGAQKAELQEFIMSNNMNTCVKMLGFLSYQDYLREMDCADILVQPSVTAADGDTEGGAPTTILEAQATGMPVVSTMHADIPNVVIPGKSALLSEERNVQRLTEHIAFLLENQNVWEDMGAAGRTFVEAYHDINKEIVHLEDKYDAV